MSAASTSPYRPEPRIQELGSEFYDPVHPASFPSSVLRFRNHALAQQLGFASLDDAAWVRHFALFEPLPNNIPTPLALRYHGHQFGSYNPDLGDGRGFLFAQVRDDFGALLDLGTKGSGQTPWSRAGDGRLTLKGGVREVLATAMLEALGVKTSRTLSLVETGEKLYRGDEPSPTRSSVLVRVGHSHLRFGTFQRIASMAATVGEAPAVEATHKLVNYTISHYFPELESVADSSGRAVALLDCIVQKTADLTAEWMTAGFCHGVLNTDNMTVTGESFDYGPYRFVPTCDPGFVAAYFDHAGRYAFGQQPAVALWNLTRLAEALTRVARAAALEAPLHTFEQRYTSAKTARMLSRLGLHPTNNQERDRALADAAWRFLERSRIGFEQFFFDVYGGPVRAGRALRGPARSLYTGTEWTQFQTLLREFEPAPHALDPHPYFQCDGPCTLLIDEIEAIWERIDAVDDWHLFNAKLSEIRSMTTALALARRS